MNLVVHNKIRLVMIYWVNTIQLQSQKVRNVYIDNTDGLYCQKQKKYSSVQYSIIKLSKCASDHIYKINYGILLD